MQRKVTEAKDSELVQRDTARLERLKNFGYGVDMPEDPDPIRIRGHSRLTRALFGTGKKRRTRIDVEYSDQE